MSKATILVNTQADTLTGRAIQLSQAEIGNALRDILVNVLHVDRALADQLGAGSGLFGFLPELDSMAVANLITAIEDRFAVTIDDDDVDGEMLETFGSLSAFVERKFAEG